MPSTTGTQLLSFQFTLLILALIVATTGARDAELLMHSIKHHVVKLHYLGQLHQLLAARTPKLVLLALVNHQLVILKVVFHVVFAANM